MKQTTPIIALFIAAVLMAACGRRSSEAALLARADSVMKLVVSIIAVWLPVHRTTRNLLA